MEVTYEEIIGILDIEYIGAKTVGNTLTPGIYENTDNNLMLKC